MVIATTLSVHCFALLHRSANQTSAECCLEGLFSQRGGGYVLHEVLSAPKPDPIGLFVV